MQRVRFKDTVPEKTVRSILHRQGFRFRLHDRRLPGKPDVVLPKYKTVLFVHGCFWHRHAGCPRATTPASRQEYWIPKFQKTIQRDKQNHRKVQLLGWRVIIVWECELKEPAVVADKLVKLLRHYSGQDPELPRVAEEPGTYRNNGD